MTIETVSELRAWQSPNTPYVIDSGILPAGSRMIIFGESKSWKSNLANHLGYCISTGTPWLGFKTNKCLVLIYQAELPKAVYQKRTVKFLDHCERSTNGNRPMMLFKTVDYVKLDSTYGAASLEKDIKEIESRFPDYHIVIIIDPLYKVVAGRIADEYDMRKFFDNVDHIKNEHDLSEIIIHHSRLTQMTSDGKAIDMGAEDVLGSSMLNNWCDTMIKIKLLNPPPKAADTISLTVALSRHAESILPSFKLKWSRLTMQPEILDRSIASEDDMSVRDLL